MNSAPATVDLSQACPPEVRQELLEQHGELRLAMARLRTRLDLGGGTVDAAIPLLDLVTRHLDFEDGRLAPALRAWGAAGELRAASLEDEHEAQRSGTERLARLLSFCPEMPATHRALRSFLSWLEREMDDVERDLLPDVPVAIAAA